MPHPAMASTESRLGFWAATAGVMLAVAFTVWVVEGSLFSDSEDATTIWIAGGLPLAFAVVIWGALHLASGVRAGPGAWWGWPWPGCWWRSPSSRASASGCSSCPLPPCCWLRRSSHRPDAGNRRPWRDGAHPCRRPPSAAIRCATHGRARGIETVDAELVRPGEGPPRARARSPGAAAGRGRRGRRRHGWRRAWPRWRPSSAGGPQGRQRRRNALGKVVAAARSWSTCTSWTGEPRRARGGPVRGPAPLAVPPAADARAPTASCAPRRGARAADPRRRRAGRRARRPAGARPRGPRRQGARADAGEEAIERMRFALGVDDDLRPFYERFRDDPLIGPVVRAGRGCGRPAPRAVRGAGLGGHRAAHRVPARGARSSGGSSARARAAAARAPACATCRRRDARRPAPALLESWTSRAPRAIALVRAAREVARGRVDLRAPDHERGWRRLRRDPRHRLVDDRDPRLARPGPPRPSRPATWPTSSSSAGCAAATRTRAPPRTRSASSSPPTGLGRPARARTLLRSGAGAGRSVESLPRQELVGQRPPRVAQAA